jgi:N-formylglutamate amidohydrolase
VRAYSNPAVGRHSLQLEINKRIYMNQKTGLKIDHFAVLQRQLMDMLRAMQVHFG